MRQNPCPFTRAEKLETQNGIMNSRAVGQKPPRPEPPDRVLMRSPAPTITETPTDVSHRPPLGSKYRTPKKPYQVK